MKKVILFLICFLTATVAAFAQTENTVPPVPENWLTYLGYLLAIYEIVIRVLPTVKNYTILSKVVAFLAWVDGANNLAKNKKNYPSA